MKSAALSPLDNKLRYAGWALGALLLCVPLVAMQFTAEVDWTLSDFVFAAVVIGGTRLMAEFLVRISRNGWYRAGAACALAAIFLTVWTNAAVGIIGSEDNPFNLWYFGVILLAVLGAALARFRPAGMAAMALLAIAFMVVLGVVAMGQATMVWPQTAFLSTPWALAATFFWQASRTA
ncbi:MAG: hypothetical protein ACTHK5_14040 [Tsuneonella sp.]